MRNLDWLQSFQMARRHINFRKHHHHNDLWLHKNLKQGDIVRCDLLTDYMGNGEAEIAHRNCLILGLDLDAQTKELRALRLARFSYGTLHCDFDTEWHIDPSMPDIRGKVVGFRDQVVLRTDRIDVVSAETEFFGFYMDRIGSVCPSLFGEINQKLAKRIPAIRIHGDITLDDTVTVPALDPKDWNKPFKFHMPPTQSRAYDTMQAADRAALAQDINGHRLALDIGSTLQLNIDYSKARGVRTFKKADEELLQKTIRTLRSAGKASRKELEKLIDKSVATLERLEKKVEDDITEERGLTGMKLSDMPDYRSLLRAHFGLDKDDAPVTKIRRDFTQAIDAESLNDLQTLGIGGLLREPAIHLPQHLWRGRYLMMRVPNLFDPENMNDAYRPCAIWKAYARLNDEGEPVLAGMELHPCTRGAANSFQYKMKVHPTLTNNPKPSFLIADMVIRAPIDAIHFQPDQRDDFYFELLPHMVDALETKRKLVEESPRGMQVFGLKTIPDDWVEIALPPPPNEKLRQRLIDWSKARFVTSQAPDIRPMAARVRKVRFRI